MLSVMLISVLMILFSTQVSSGIWSVATTRIDFSTWTWSFWGRKWLFDFSVGRIQMVLLDPSNNTGAIDVKMDGSGLEEKSSFKMLGLPFSSKLEWGSYIISIAKTASKKIRALIRFMKFLSLEVVLQPCMEYCCHLWGGTTSCYLELIDSYKNGYVGLLVFHLLPLLSPWLIVKI